MYFEGHFSKGILSTFSEKVDIKEEIINNLNDGDSMYDDIVDEIENLYDVDTSELEMNFEEYVSVNEESICLDFDSDDEYYISFQVDCDFDMERFARDNNLKEREGKEDI